MRAPMLSLDNAYGEDDAREFDERLKRALGLPPKSTLAVCRGAEDRRPEHRADLRARRAGPRRDARRRRAGRGRDAERADHPRRAAAARQGGPAHRIEVRGEVFLPRASFARVNREREEAEEPLFANPRNAAAGTMRTLEPALVAKRELGAFVYQLVDTRSGREESRRPRRPTRPAAPRASRRSPANIRASHSRVLTMLDEWGLPVNKHWRRCESIDAVIEFCREWADERHELEFETDGVVIKLDDLAAARAGGLHVASSRAGPSPTSSRRSRRRRSCWRSG